MSKSEDYLDDLLNSVSDANRRNNKKDIENLIQSMNEEAAKPREREKKPVEKKHEDYSGTGFLREFEKELATGAADDFLQEFEMELDEEASNQADIDVKEDQTSDMEAASATKQPEAANQSEETNQLQDASEPISSEGTGMATDGSAASDMMEDVNDIMDAVRKKVGDSGEEEHMDTSKTPEDDASEEEEPLGFFDTLDEDSAAEIPEAPKTESEEEEPLLSEDDDAINLMDMLSGDADLSDIGDLLKADENGEELEHSEDEDGEVQDEFERLGSIEELKDLKEAKEKRKKQGFFSKIMSVLFGPDEDEDDTKIAEDDSLGSISSENREILKEMDADEGAGKKEKKKKEKKEKKEKAKKEKAPKVKKEKPPKEIDRTPPLPKKPVILIFIMALSILILILLGSSNLQYGQNMQQAKDDFASGSYVTAFQTVAGSSVKGKDENFYKKAQVLASIQSEYQSYESLSGINENEMALDALIRGYGRCVDGVDLAQEYEITDEMEGLKAQILQQLSDYFGVSEEKAAELHAMTKRTDYTKAIQEILAAAGLE